MTYSVNVFRRLYMPIFEVLNGESIINFISSFILCALFSIVEHFHDTRILMKSISAIFNKFLTTFTSSKSHNSILEWINIRLIHNVIFNSKTITFYGKWHYNFVRIVCTFFCRPFDIPHENASFSPIDAILFWLGIFYVNRIFADSCSKGCSYHELKSI